MKPLFRIPILHRYIAGQFLVTLGVCVLALTTLFLVFDLFERMRVFVREDAQFSFVVQYMLLKVPQIVQLMMPIAILVATLITIGRLSQNSEMTAMRACGASVIWLVSPLLVLGACFSLLMLILSETLVPAATQKAEEIYLFDIRDRDQSGAYDRSDFWYRVDNAFYSIALYNSRDKVLDNLTIYNLDENFKLQRRLDAAQAQWQNEDTGWVMSRVVESIVSKDGAIKTQTFDQLPLLIEEQPQDFYNMKRRPETMNYQELSLYIEKLQQEGVPVTEYLVAQSAKLAFPFVNLIVVMIAIPFALITARSGTMTYSFVLGVSVGFGYYVFHAISTSLGSAELLPITASAWAANIVLGSLAAYLLLSIDAWNPKKSS